MTRKLRKNIMSGWALALWAVGCCAILTSGTARANAISGYTFSETLVNGINGDKIVSGTFSMDAFGNISGVDVTAPGGITLNGGMDYNYSSPNGTFMGIQLFESGVNSGILQVLLNYEGTVAGFNANSVFDPNVVQLYSGSYQSDYICPSCNNGASFSSFFVSGTSPAVPEPGALALFGTGLTMLGLIRLPALRKRNTIPAGAA